MRSEQKRAWHRKSLRYYRKKRNKISLYKSAMTRGDYVLYFMNRGLEEKRLMKLNKKTLRIMFLNTNIKDANKAYKQYNSSKED